MTTTNQPLVPYYVKGLALGVPIFLTAIHLWSWLLFVPATVRAGSVDFRQCYTAAHMVRTGQRTELYDYGAQKKNQDEVVAPQLMPLPFVAPAYEALTITPLSYFSFRTAYSILVLFNAAAIVACFLVLRPWMANIARIYWWLPIALFTGSLPLAAAMMQGQDSIFLTLLLAISYRLSTRKKDVLAGVVSGLALFKFSIVIPIVLLLLLWRRWRFVVGFCASAVVVAMVCLAITGVAGEKQYLLLIFSLAGLHHPAVPLALYPVHWYEMANLHGLTFGLLHRWIAEQEIAHIAMVTSLLALAWVTVKARGIKDTGVLLLIAIPAAVLASHHSYIHDLAPLVVPVVVTLNRFLPNETQPGASRLEGRCAALAFVAPVVFCYAAEEFWIVALAILPFLYSLLRAEFGEMTGSEKQRASRLAVPA